MIRDDSSDKAVDRKSDIMVTHNIEDASVEEKANPSKVADEETAKYAGAPIKVSDADNKRLFWKINRRILSIMLVTYFCQSLDKGTLNFASIMHIKRDAHLGGQEYQWLGTILYMGILAGELPQNFLLQKLPVAKFLAANVFCWGAVVTCSAASKNFASLMVVRFLLGFFESSVQPAFLIITTMWYRRSEQAVLTSLWYCMTGVQLMVGGLLAYGVSHYTNGVIFPWQLLFLILGLATIVLSIAIALFLPDSPMAAKCFSEDDKRLMVERIRENETGIQNKQYKRYQVIEALTDPFSWCIFALIVVANLVIGGLGVFSNLIISQFGFSLLQTQLLNIAQGAVTVIVMIGSATVAQKWKQTCITMILWTIPAAVGTIVIVIVKPNSNNAGGLLIAFYCTQFFLAQGNMIISLVTRNVAGQTKKSTIITMTFVGWAAGNMAAPQIFQTSDAPRYIKGFVAHLCIYGTYIALVILTRIILMRKNVKKRAAAEAAGLSEEIDHQQAFDDLTDQENPNFRYVY
ncbi:related to allantoate permease [Melanopsichium pennsylvanicum]|uniref:Related to allantoate permease n=2 Tax=Melanopsichium pennsylvanicum TaxID=63383 RepID=A0AAJ5C5U8_9BASI|nr:related to allantoate permease [Melanopsichium pennsylvanicum 4]SNX85111.1 related to allantoate permease [Melanopsichium pennsylvanicum]